MKNSPLFVVGKGFEGEKANWLSGQISETNDREKLGRWKGEREWEMGKLKTRIGEDASRDKGDDRVERATSEVRR